MPNNRSICPNCYCEKCTCEDERASSQVERGFSKPDLIERFKKKIWIVAHQLPRSRIVGLFKSYIDAQTKYNKVPDQNCPLIYPCPIYMVKNQAGYDKRLKLR